MLYMMWIVENWFVILSIAVAVCVLGMALHRIYRLPKNEKIKAIKALLLEWVEIAEKELGSGQGQAKLQYVYTMFMARFPVFGRIIPFVIFSKWVDEALDKMEEMLVEKKDTK